MNNGEMYTRYEMNGTDDITEKRKNKHSVLKLSPVSEKT